MRDDVILNPMNEPLNVFDETLAPCGMDPMTGFFRDGCCNTSDQDGGLHAVCAVVTEAFLAYSRAQGNDLVTPRLAFGFPGLKPGDRWCLCASRWAEAERHGVAPPVDLRATHRRALERVPLETLRAYALN